MTAEQAKAHAPPESLRKVRTDPTMGPAPVAGATSIGLKDGTLLRMRALRPDDKSLLQAFFGRLSPTSIHYRVFAGHGSLTAKELAYLTELDPSVHVALAATVVRDDGDERLVGVARYIRVDVHGVPASTSLTAEVAFTVEDAFQQRGIGTHLLERLAELARGAGVEQMRADVLTDNARMMEVFTDSGFVVRRVFADGVFHVTFPIAATAAFLEASQARALSELGRPADESKPAVVRAT